MFKSREVLGQQALKVVMAAVAVTCLGAAVFAAPLTVTPRSKISGAAQEQAAAEKTSFAPLASGPALQLGRAGAGADEDCVKVTKMVAPNGDVYATRGLVCSD